MNPSKVVPHRKTETLPKPLSKIFNTPHAADFQRSICLMVSNYPSHTYRLSHIPNPDEAIQSSPPPQYTPRSGLSLLDIPIYDNPLFNNDPPLDEPFEDVPFAQSPARNKSPLEDGIIIHHHPLINGAYTRVTISCTPMLTMQHDRTTL